ncbi:alpha/beta hydrolase [Bradyrhizobium sp.]|uniref:alpha/beta hydrolase n=1 Tax=Bradyrhizobium sp. TaxID=376 RepID=UPI0039E225BD
MNGAIEPDAGPAMMPVYLHYTQSELDRAFDQTQWASNMKDLVARWAETSRSVRDNEPRMETRRYGAGANEDLQIFPAEDRDRPIQVFIHGGEWKRRDNLGTAFPALSLVPAGFNFVNLNFEAVPNVTIPEMLDQVQRAVVWIYRNARDFGADPDAIHLSGHSSGAHLAAVLATTEWEKFGVPADILKSVACIGGLYDMEPVLLSMRRAWVKLTAEEADRLSPLYHVDRIRAPVAVVYGGNESPEFRRQALAFHHALLAAGKRSDLTEMPGQNHFEVLDALHHPGSRLLRILAANAG